MSYQFASSNIEGWNDCPVLPQNPSSTSLSSLDSRKSRKQRRYVSHIDQSDAPAAPSPSPRIPSRSTSTASFKLPPLPQSAKDEVQQKLNRILKNNNPDSDIVSHMYKIMSNDDNVRSLNTILIHYESNPTDAKALQELISSVTLPLDFQKSLCSLLLNKNR